MRGFVRSWKAKDGVLLDDAYCASTDGQADSRCSNGRPVKTPPGYCYGYTDFIEFVRDCEVPFLPRKADPGRQKLEIYLKLMDPAVGCENGITCPDGAAYFKLLEKQPPASGTPYVPENLLTQPTQP
jgi:hypothetical protein